MISTYLVYLVIILVLFLVWGMSKADMIDFFPYAAKEIWINPIGWCLLISPFAIFHLIKYLITSWKTQQPMTFVKRFSFSIVLPVLFLFSGFSFSKWYTQSEVYHYEWDDSVNNESDTIKNRYALDGKQRGMHVFGWRDLDQTRVQDLVQTNMEWITLVPFAGQEDYDSDFVGRRNTDYSKWSRRDSFYMKKIKTLKEYGFYIMIKPHIWMHSPSSGKWRSDILPKTAEGWERWAESYRQYIFHYARLSALMDIELFCIGTELHTIVKKHPDFWRQLIIDIRKIYPGKITYAANWNAEMYDVDFWDQLDYIGVQAYFPLTDKTEPKVRDLKKGWKRHIQQLEALHKKYQRPILFSELGYKSTPDAAIEPWAWANTLSGLYKKVSFQTQANCYEAFFQMFWDKDWFAGVHFWEWQSERRRDKQRKNINFTPQEKPAENIMTRWFAK